MAPVRADPWRHRSPLHLCALPLGWIAGDFDVANDRGTRAPPVHGGGSERGVGARVRRLGRTAPGQSDRP